MPFYLEKKEALHSLTPTYQSRLNIQIETNFISRDANPEGIL